MRQSINHLRKKMRDQEKIVCLTCYDAGFARIIDRLGIDVILVGDSLGMVVQGHESTLMVTIEQMVYHTRCVARVSQSAFIIADMPFASYNHPQQALETAVNLIQGGAHMVKLEGGTHLEAVIQYLAKAGIPVCAHLGLLPQSIYKIGAYRVQGKNPLDAKQIREDALCLEQAGADILILECVPRTLATEITETLKIPVIGIGAGMDCDGQILVLYDILGITTPMPKFAYNFLQDHNSIEQAIQQYAYAVKTKRFPSLEYSFE